MTVYASGAATLQQTTGPSNATTGYIFADGSLAGSAEAALAKASTDAATAATDAATGTTDGAALVAYMGTVGLTGSLVASVTLTAAQGISLFTAGVLANTDLTTLATDIAVVTADIASALAQHTGNDILLSVNATNVPTLSKLRAGVNHVLKRLEGNATFSK